MSHKLNKRLAFGVNSAFALAVTLLFSACAGIGSHSNNNQAESMIKSPNDSKNYQYLALPNGLTALLISDPGTDKAAVSLDINIGSGSDPKDRQGLAHFLEHMLFLGTKKYPKAGEYQAFISEHGGSHNAYTAFAHTNYFFDIEKGSLEPAIDRFAQFFIAPLFTPDYVDREKHAVHSEYQSKLKNDARRGYDTFKQIINPDHPLSTFSVGSLDTLSDREGNAVADDLAQFYKDHYSANLMTLVVLGKESIAELKTLVSSKFSAIPNRDQSPLQIEVPLFKPGQLPQEARIEPVKDIKRLHLTFPVPPIHAHFRTQPASYITNLLGHEGKGSLLAVLKERGWAHGLSAGMGHDESDFATIEIAIKLTEQGLAARNQVVTLFFQTVKLIRERGIASWRYREQGKLTEIGFRFEETRIPIHYVRSLAHRMQRHNGSADLLRAPYLMDRFDAPLIASYLDELRPDNMLLTVISKGLNTDKRSQWFDVPYAQQIIDRGQLEQWKNPSTSASIKLPEANPFIPKSLAVKQVSKKVANHPQLVLQQPGLSLWHRTDTQFGQPKADFYFSVKSPLATDSPRNTLLTRLYTRTVKDQLNDFAYPATLAGLHYKIYTHSRGISVRLSGYQDKQQVLLKKILTTLDSPTFDEARFALIKKDLQRNLENSLKERPIDQAFGRAQQMMMASSWDNTQLLDALETVELKDLKEFRQNFFSQIELTALANGSHSKVEARKLAQTLSTTLLKSQKATSVPLSAVTLLEGEHPVVFEFNVDHPDSSIISYIQGQDRSVDNRALFSLLTQVLHTPFYHQLRTQKQLGYVVFATAMPLFQVPGIAFAVQSPNTDGVKIEHHISTFLDEFSAIIDAMDEETLNTHKRAVTTRILEKETRLAQLSERYWRTVNNPNPDFSDREALVASINAMTLEQFKAAFNNTLVNNQGKRLVISAKGANSMKGSAEGQWQGFHHVQNADVFKREAKPFPEN